MSIIHEIVVRCDNFESKNGRRPSKIYLGENKLKAVRMELKDYRGAVISIKSGGEIDINGIPVILFTARKDQIQVE